MKDVEFLRAMENSGLGVFGISDVARIINKNRGYARLFAKRLVDRGLMVRVEKSKYALADTDALVVASNLVFPSYISFLSGLAYHRRTTQLPRDIQVAASKSKKGVHYGSTGIVFVKLKGERIFGYERARLAKGYAFVGELEKVILDSLLLPGRCPLSESLGALRGGIDEKKIVEYARLMGSAVLLRRLGYLLETAGIDTNGLEHDTRAKYEPLNPHLHSRGERDRRWRLIVNEVL